MRAFYYNSAGSTQGCDSSTCDCCMPQWIKHPWAVYSNTSSHSYSHVKSMCLTSWTVDLDHIQWSSRRLQVKRDPKGTSKWGVGLELALSGDSLGAKPKGYNNGTVEMCRCSWKSSFGTVTKAQWLQERTVVREKPHTGMDTISGASMGLTDATN